MHHCSHHAPLAWMHTFSTHLIKYDLCGFVTTRYPTTSVTLTDDISRNGVHPSRDGQTLCTFIQASKQAFISVLTLTFLFKPLWPIQQKQGHKGSFPISAPTWQMGYLTLSSANWKHTVRNGLAQVKHQSVFHSSVSIISVCLTPCKNN